jgi:hypothetical protein
MRGKIILLLYMLSVLAINVWLHIRYVKKFKHLKEKDP